MSFIAWLMWPIWRLFYQGIPGELFFISPSLAKWYESVVMYMIELPWTYENFDHDWVDSFLQGASIGNIYLEGRDDKIIMTLKQFNLVYQTGEIELEGKIQAVYSMDRRFAALLASIFSPGISPYPTNLRYIEPENLTNLIWVGVYNREAMADPIAGRTYRRVVDVGDMVTVKGPAGAMHYRAIAEVTKVDRASGLYHVRVVRYIAKSPLLKNTVGQELVLSANEIWVSLSHPDTHEPTLAEGYIEEPVLESL